MEASGKREGGGRGGTGLMGVGLWDPEHGRARARVGEAGGARRRVVIVSRIGRVFLNNSNATYLAVSLSDVAAYEQYQPGQKNAPPSGIQFDKS